MRYHCKIPLFGREFHGGGVPRPEARDFEFRAEQLLLAALISSVQGAVRFVSFEAVSTFYLKEGEYTD